jgi:diguanylate cyclase (GGDEF)-like protein
MDRMTDFEYSTLALVSEDLSQQVEKALASEEVKQSISRTFYLTRRDLPGNGAISDAVEQCADGRYQLIFVDATTPEKLDVGIAAVRAIREKCPSPEPVALIAPETSAHMIDLLNAGVWYFLEVPVANDKLAPILARDVAMREADGLARTDGLSGLYNRAFFEDALRDHVEHMMHDIGGKRASAIAPVSLILIDIDQFGQAFEGDRDAGDMFLRQIGVAFREEHRHTDVVARIGGDEFGSLLVGMNYSLGLMRGEILRKSVARLTLPPEAKSRPTISVGVVTFPTFFDDPQQLYWYALRALKKAKEHGGGACFGFNPHGTPAPFSELGG